MATRNDYYLPDEERFGFFTSHMYNMFTGFGPMKKFHQFVTRGILSGNPGKILDIGFGTGQALKKILQGDRDIMAFGVEPSPTMFKVAGRKLRAFSKEGKVKLALGSSRNIPFNEKFDIIYSSLSFHHWKNQEESVLNVLNYLNPGGEFKVFEYGDYLIQGYKKAAKAHAISREDIERLKKVADFEVQESGEFLCLVFKAPPELKV